MDYDDDDDDVDEVGEIESSGLDYFSKPSKPSALPPIGGGTRSSLPPISSLPPLTPRGGGQSQRRYQDDIPDIFG